MLKECSNCGEAFDPDLNDEEFCQDCMDEFEDEDDIDAED